MSKQKKNVTHTAQFWYDTGEADYLLAKKMYEDDEPQEVVDRNFYLASAEFWFSILLGHPKAPYSLYACVSQGFGIEKDGYLSKLMFGVALKLGDPRCNAQIHEVQIPSSINSNIEKLHQLILQSQKQIPAEGVSAAVLFDRLLPTFDQTIKLPSGKTMSETFMVESIPSINEEIHHQPNSSYNAHGEHGLGEDNGQPQPHPSSSSSYQNASGYVPPLPFQSRQPQPYSSSTPSSSETSSTVNWKNSGAAKITDIKDAHDAIYGQIYDQDVTRQFNFKVNHQPVTIIKYRSITMPDQIKPGETFNYSFALKEPNGLNIGKSDAAYLEVKYNSYGKLVKLSVPGNPAISQNDPYAPAIVVYHSKVYTLPVSSGHYWHLKQVVESNGGSFEIQNPGPVPHVESIIPTMPIMHHGQYQQPLIALQPSDHHVPLAGSAYHQHNSEDTGCCILM